MSLFGGNKFGGDNDNELPNKATYQLMMNLVGEKTPFGGFYIKTICALLKERNVPSSRYPSRYHVMSKLIEFIDHDKLNAWLEKYIEIEAIDVDTSEVDDK